jgi:DNA-nicking Smr family endonuclease
MGQTASNITSFLWTFLSSPKPDEPGYQYRQAAFAEGRRAQIASSQSQAAYGRNDHPEARQFSNLSKKHWKEHDRLHKLAEAEIFKHHNPTYPTDLSKIDLHGLLVKEAEVKVRAHIGLCKRAEISRTILITGWGSHSKDGFAKIKPAMQALCQQENLRVFVDNPNVGCVTVEIGVATRNVGSDKCIVM